MKSIQHILAFGAAISGSYNLAYALPHNGVIVIDFSTKLTAPFSVPSEIARRQNSILPFPSKRSADAAPSKRGEDAFAITMREAAPSVKRGADAVANTMRDAAPSKRGEDAIAITMRDAAPSWKRSANAAPSVRDAAPTKRSAEAAPSKRSAEAAPSKRSAEPAPSLRDSVDIGLRNAQPSAAPSKRSVKAVAITMREAAPSKRSANANPAPTDKRSAEAEPITMRDAAPGWGKRSASVEAAPSAPSAPSAPVEWLSNAPNLEEREPVNMTKRDEGEWLSDAPILEERAPVNLTARDEGQSIAIDELENDVGISIWELQMRAPGPIGASQDAIADPTSAKRDAAPAPSKRAEDNIEDFGLAAEVNEDDEAGLAAAMDKVEVETGADAIEMRGW